MDKDVCENGASSELVGLTVANGKLFGINPVCIAELDTASGEVKAAQKLGKTTGAAKLAQGYDGVALTIDMAGTPLVGGVSRTDKGYGIFVREVRLK